ncbi:MAG TPA: site-specific DNA-methyltransferase [Bacteroidota bacterium]|nr:site-specific DNA-methyltransferase [Bacteroidota bacterium]
MTISAREKFQALLRELFEFDCADLDFGIYRIMNHKRQVIERFIAVDLPEAIAQELQRGALAEQGQAQQALSAARQKVMDALDADGNLATKYRETKAGKEYLEAQAKAQGARSTEALEAAIYNHLYTFFSRYWQDGDFISKRRYSKKERYAIPYNGEEVTLYWANHDQYYVKTGEYFTNYSYKAPNGVTVHFKLQQADVEQNNVKGEKRFFLPVLSGIAWDETARTLTIPFQFRPLTAQEAIAYGQKNQQEAIIAKSVIETPKRVKTAEALAALTAERRKKEDSAPVSYLEHHLRQYTRRNTSDFFIHKDLKGFLSRELDFYLKNEVLNLEEIEAAGEKLTEGWFQLMRLIKRIGNQIVDFLAQMENFQKMLWEKKKFITETFYVITIGNIPADFYPEIASCEAQWEEWKELLHIDKEETKLFRARKGKKKKRIEFLKAHSTLPLDTRHFSQDFTDRLLASFENLDDLTDGLLIHSENWQALNLLQTKYRERVKCIYIDPPYNTDASPIIYKNDYRSSTWVSMMNNRLILSRRFLYTDGMLAVAIDDFQQKELHFLMEMTFGKENILGTVVVRSNPSGRPGTKGFATSHEYLIFAAQSPDVAVAKLGRTEEVNSRYKHSDAKGCYMWELLRKRGSGSERKDSPKLYFPLYVGSDYIRVPEMTWEERKKEWIIHDTLRENEAAAYPIDEDGIHRRWRWSVETIKNNLTELKAVTTKSGLITVYYKYRPPEGIIPTTTWIDAKYSATEHGTNVVKNLFHEYDPFSFPKSIFATRDALFVMGMTAANGYCMDYFAGSGTTGHAVINLNREDGGQRKFILVEMAHYFDTVLLPRIKKVTFTPEWKDGKPKRMATAEEAERSPRIVRVIRLESYEDALNNLTFDEEGGKHALGLFKNDYLLHYMLKWETRHSETLLDVKQLQSPFSYKLRLHRDGETRERLVDLPETFNYLLGLDVQTRRVYEQNGLRYLVYRGVLPNGRTVAVIWRETRGWKEADCKRDRDFVASHKLTQSADEVWVNGDSLVPGAQSLDPIFKERMFANAEA